MTPNDVVAALTLRNEHVLLPADVPRAVLDDVAAQLALQRNRVLRPSALDILTLPGLLADLVAQAPAPAPAVPDLERGFELLTDPGPDFQRVVLMLDRADALDPAALRYVQFAAHGAPLRLLFAGGPQLHGLLAREEFGLLRRGFAGYAPASLQIPTPMLAASVPSSIADPMPGRIVEGYRAEAFPGGAEAALEFAAFEKGLAEGGCDPGRPLEWHAPISEPSQRSAHFLFAGAAMAILAVAAVWLIDSGLLASCFAVVLRTAGLP